MQKDLFVVGIGASAGSLPAMIEFFQQVPAGTKASFVVISHLLRDKRSFLDEILSRHSELPVVRVEADTPIQAGHIYVLTEGTYLTCQFGILRPQPRDEGGLNRAADIFLSSLASDAGSRSIGIILSGGGSDGLEGAKAINEANGQVLVQDPESAQVDGMPVSVIVFDHPHKVLAPRDMPAGIIDIIAAADRQLR